jgi:hypothetical protein
MKNTATGWAIDPVTRTITAQAHTWESAKAWIGCDLLECVRLDGGELWVNEEGFLKEDHRPWVLNRGQMIAGRAFLVGGEWTNHLGAHFPEVAWLSPSAHVEPPKARAYPMTPDGLHQMALDAQEERGMAELAAVGAAPADWPNDGRGDKDGLRQLLRAPTLGDFVTVASGLTGMVMAIGDGWVEVRFIDGRVIEVPTQSVEVVDVD